MTRAPVAGRRGTPRRTLRRWLSAAACAAGLALALPGPAAAASQLAGPAPGGLAAPLPAHPVIAQGVSSANPAHLVRNRSWDFEQMRHVFNGVALLPGDTTAVADAVRAGLSVVLEFDYKADFFAGRDISAKVDAVVAQIEAAPGTIAAVDIADRINEKYSPDQALQYLAATGRVLHREVPGVPVVVNVSDWELTCGRSRQSSCSSHDARFQYETNQVADVLYRSGDVDGFTIANNLKNEDVEAQRAAWTEARDRWPAPFILWSTSSQLSFPDGRYAGDADSAARTVAAYMTAPMDGGADGLALWAWHQLYRGSYYSFLDKDGGPNPLWSSMAAAARDIDPAEQVAQIRGGTPPVASIDGKAAEPLTRPRGSSVGLGLWSVLGFALIVGVLATGVVARLRRRAVPPPPSRGEAATAPARPEGSPGTSRPERSTWR